MKATTGRIASPRAAAGASGPPALEVLVYRWSPQTAESGWLELLVTDGETNLHSPAPRYGSPDSLGDRRSPRRWRVGLELPRALFDAWNGDDVLDVSGSQGLSLSLAPLGSHSSREDAVGPSVGADLGAELASAERHPELSATDQQLTEDPSALRLAEERLAAEQRANSELTERLDQQANAAEHDGNRMTRRATRLRARVESLETQLAVEGARSASRGRQIGALTAKLRDGVEGQRRDIDQRTRAERRVKEPDAAFAAEHHSEFVPADGNNGVKAGWWRWIIAAGIALVLGAFVIGAVLAAGEVSTDGRDGAPARSLSGPLLGGVSAAGKTEIPRAYLRLYKLAARRYELDWAILAAIGSVESDHGRSELPGARSGTNRFGAAGPMQLTRESWRSYGSDADGSGTISPYEPADAIVAMAAYLRASGAPGAWEKAILAYNRDPAYVDAVRAVAARYRSP